jgi:CheY-like chemotaxis protein
MKTDIRTILLAEDNSNDVELTLAAFRENHLLNDIVVTRDGAETLDYLFRRNTYDSRANGNPALILLDLKMPKVDGLEVLRTIKSDAKLRTIPVVILTSSRQEQDLLRSYNLGVNAYVVKPVDFREFVDAVKALGGFWAVVNEPPPTDDGELKAGA